jgi:CRP-like cAMP-binding protein
MSLLEDVQRLAAIPPFSALPREAVQIIAFSSERLSLQAGHHLFLGQGKTDAGYFVLSGAVELHAGKKVRRVEAGGLIGAAALIAAVERRYEASALEASELLRIPRSVFLRVLQEFPQSKRAIRLALRQRGSLLSAPLEALDRKYFSAPRASLRRGEHD